MTTTTNRTPILADALRIAAHLAETVIPSQHDDESFVASVSHGREDTALWLDVTGTRAYAASTHREPCGWTFDIELWHDGEVIARTYAADTRNLSPFDAARSEALQLAALRALARA